MAEVMADLFPGSRVEVGETLRGSDRATVRRVLVDGRSVIVKEFAEREGWAREAAGLRALAGTGCAAEVVAESADPWVLASVDLGTGASVSDRLIGTDPVAAGAAVVEWATAVGRLHAAGLGRRREFVDGLAERGPDYPIDETPRILDEVEELFAEQAPTLGFDLPAGVVAELRRVVEHLGPDSPHATISPSDACPDNNIGRDGGVTLIDFEGAQWRHVAWDVTNLTLPWPTCWCSWRMPEDVTAAALDRYRAETRAALPYVDTPEFGADLRLAESAWSVFTSVWFLHGVFAGDKPHPDPRVVEPTRRALIAHRLARAAEITELPVLSAFATRLACALADHLAGQRLALGPAFR